MFGFSPSQCILSYHGHKTKNVILLSTMHLQPGILQGDKRKPQVVMDYNLTKGGVDTKDQMCLNFTTKRQHPQKGRLHQFMRSVAKDLMRFQMQRRFQALVRAPRPLRDVMRACLQDMGLSMEERPAAAAREAKKIGRCGLCNWKDNKKGTAKCHKCCNFLCKDHIAKKKFVLCSNCDA
ncbi:hypothetical protein RRG08_001447 [Elysia crispata]|uniref:PiggyBac transposable element-derived protein domain-containing protein n=1 Tax=Elysia crispata TaxID=231223 RepID=A0AAE0ZR11_9GAST|nr:hypothetical protein RRG08_001447 [Elysia crispata]